MQIDVVILSLCLNRETFQMNDDCISSLFDSEDKHEFNVVVMESNKNFHDLGFRYKHPVTIIIPEERFNYNRFLNIAIKNTNNSMICFCNNDLLFKKGWLSEILRIKDKYPQIQSFSPKDPEYKTVKNKFIGEDHYLGYEVGWHFFAACFIIERKVFDKTGLFDEQFDFYYQDCDFAMCLRKHGIIHALVTQSNVTHVVETNGKVRNEYTTMQKLEADKVLFHKKWGSQRMIGIKNRLAKGLIALRLNFILKYLY